MPPAFYDACDECDGDVHFGCTGLAAFPGDDDPFTCAICARRAVRPAWRREAVRFIAVSQYQAGG